VRPSRTGSAPSPPSLPPSPSSRTSWTPSRASTTTSGRTDRCRTAAPRPPFTPPGPKPSLVTGSVTPMTASAATRSARSGTSPCAPAAGCTTSASAAPTSDLRRNLRPAARPGPAHPHHQRRHRRTAPRTDPRPSPGLPAHRTATRPQKEKHPEPDEGSRCPRCLATSHSSRGRIRTFVNSSKVSRPAWLDDPGPFDCCPKFYRAWVRQMRTSATEYQNVWVRSLADSPDTCTPGREVLRGLLSRYLRRER
jgi:hypothetical protein